MLDLAKHELARILDALAPDLARGVPVVGLEPSCMASFRDELPRLFPADERARKLADNSFLLSEFLERENRSEEHTSELQSLMRISYAVFCLTKNKSIKI